VEVLLVDLNYDNIQAARLAGLPALYASILSEAVRERIALSGIGRLLAMTPNDEVNTLAAVRYARWFGRSNVYQLVSARVSEREPAKATEEIRGRSLFGEGWTYARLASRLAAANGLRRTRLTREFNFDALRRQAGADLLPMFTVDDAGDAAIFTRGNHPVP